MFGVCSFGFVNQNGMFASLGVYVMAYGIGLETNSWVEIGVDGPEAAMTGNGAGRAKPDHQPEAFPKETH
eukprot:3273296-Pyramimonas_sp.AAC.1